MPALVERSSPNIKEFNRQLLLVAVLWALLMASGLGVIYTTHVTRQQFNELEGLRRTSAELHVEWGQYLLERSSWASYNRISELAEGELKMDLPDQDKVIVVQQR